jgi:glycosyltransferase involved in cell wall biosynthesis
MNDSLRISVVVPTYNRLDTLRTVIPALVAQDVGAAAFEVIVADSNSTDGTADYLAEVARTARRWCSSPTPTSSRRPICSPLTWRVTRAAARP